jgi:arylsulfatase A-like enzyme
VLVVVLDTVRADAIGAFGAATHTPNIDNVATRGARFDDVTAPSPWTWPSHASLFTGLDPWVHGARRTAQSGSELEPLHFAPLRDDVPTLAEAFRTAGYRTVLHSANVLVGPQFPSLVRGFEKVGHAERDDTVVRATLDVLAEADARPVFAVVNLYGAHAPYTNHGGTPLETDPPAWVAPWIAGDAVELQRRGKDGEPTLMTAYLSGALIPPPGGLAYVRAIYDQEVEALDLYVGVLGSELFRRSPDAVLAVVADHGEGFGEHGILGHGIGLYPELLHVPLAVLAPGRIAPGSVISAPLALLDLFDGLQALAGIGPRSGAFVDALDGNAAPRAIRGMAEPDEYVARVTGRKVFAEPWMLYRQGRWAAVVHPSAAEVYDLDVDPRMLHPLADVPAEAQGVLARAREVPESAVGTADPDRPDAATVERLRALGYVQ